MGLRTVAALLEILGLVVYALPAHAWGDLGPKIICEIAFQEFDDKARAEVDRLIGLDTFQSFPESRVWPDHPRKRAEEHFINVGRSFTHFTATSCPTAPKCTFTVIAADTDVLKTSTDDQARNTWGTRWPTSTSPCSTSRGAVRGAWAGYCAVPILHFRQLLGKLEDLPE